MEKHVARLRGWYSSAATMSATEQSHKGIPEADELADVTEVAVIHRSDCTCHSDMLRHIVLTEQHNWSCLISV